MYCLSDICSLCLVSHQNLESILSPDIDGTVIQEKLRPLLLELIHFMPSVPKYICNNCLLDVNCIYKFRLRWIENTRTLKKYVHKLEVNGSYTNLSVILTDTKDEKEYLFKLITQNKSETYLKETDMQKNFVQCDVPISEFNEYNKTNFIKGDTQINYSSKEVKIEIEETKLSYLEDNVVKQELETPYEMFKEFKNENDIDGNVNISCSKNEEFLYIKSQHIVNPVSMNLKYEDYVSEPEPFEDNDSDEEYLPSNASSSDMSEEGDSDVDAAATQAPVRCKIIESKETNSNVTEYATATSTTNENIKKVQNQNKNSCKDCHKAFTSSTLLEIHRRTHSDKRPYKCSTCHKTFKYITVLKMHFRTHTGEKPHVCEVCNKAFSQSSTLESHKRRIHSNDRPFKCSVCNKAFSQIGDVTRHMRTHTGEKPYACNTCDKRYCRLADLLNHKRKHHSAHI